MLKGGYKIIDLKDVNLITDEAAVKIDGIYEAIEGNYRKPLLVSGLTIDGVEKADFFAIATISDSSFEIKYDTKKITISDADEVIITNI